MQAERIGIIGGYGAGGLACARALLSTASCDILIGGRNVEKLREAAAELGPRVRGAVVDLSDPKELEAFCRECRLVVNCAGPSRRILDTIALAALRANAHYIDLGGDEPLFERLSPLHDELRKKNLTFILSVGIYPGLSGLFTSFCIETAPKPVSAVESHFISEGEPMTPNAAYDVVCSLEDGFGEGMARYENGEVKRGGVGPVWLDLPPPGKERLLVYPSLTQEMVQLAKRHKLTAAGSYVALPPATMQTLFAVHADKQYLTETDKTAAAERLAEASQRDCNGRPPRTIYHLVMRGAAGAESATATLRHEEGSARLTGLIVGCAAAIVLAGKDCRAGRHMLPEALRSTALMDLLAEYGIAPTMPLDAEDGMDSGFI